jgi:hypothetical protein
MQVHQPADHVHLPSAKASIGSDASAALCNAASAAPCWRRPVVIADETDDSSRAHSWARRRAAVVDGGADKRDLVRADARDIGRLGVLAPRSRAKCIELSDCPVLL